MGKGVKKKLKKQKRSASNKRAAQSTAAEQDMEQAAILRCSSFIGTLRFMMELSRRYEMHAVAGNVDAYVLLSNLYPVVNTRPEDVRNLIQQGFARTGDSRLQQ